MRKSSQLAAVPWQSGRTCSKILAAKGIGHLDANGICLVLNRSCLRLGRERFPCNFCSMFRELRIEVNSLNFVWMTESSESSEYAVPGFLT